MINKSRGPLVFFKSGLIWLFFSCFLQQVRALELIFPRFCADFLSFGRVDAAAEACFLYGWGSCIAFAVGFSLCASIAVRPMLAFFWNLSVAIGVSLILGGKVILAPNLPPELTFFLLLLSLFLCLPVLTACLQSDIIAFRWLLASFFLLPWLLFTASVLLREGRLTGAARLPVEAWFHEGFLWLWLGGSALAFAYYLLSKVLSTPIVEQRLIPIGFWMYFSVGVWASLRTIAGGAVPAWISAAGTSANLLLWVPVLGIWRNLCGWRFSISLESSPALRFAIFGSYAFVLCSIQAIVLYSKSGAAFFQFTDFATSQAILTRYGFLTSIFCGVIYYFAPRILLRGWPRPRAIFWHFQLQRIGLVLIIVSLAIGGTVQGALLNNPALPFSASISAALPWRYLASVGWSVFLVAQIIFMLHFARLCGRSEKESG